MPTKFLLVTDLDHTLIGDNEATIILTEKLSPLRSHFHLIYATGRSRASVQQLQQDFEAITGHKLLQPDYLITGVGSEIYDRSGQDQIWAEHLSQDWQRDAIATLIQDIPTLSLQPATELNPWKLSYYTQSQDNPALVETLRLRIATAGLAAQVVFSSDRDLDILPKNSGKGQAMTYLREQLKIHPHRTLVCGDSGNDITLFQQQTLGVIVSNSQPELLDWDRRHPSSDRYRAASPYAWAILEAIAHFEL
jgi:sucrose-6-phosphatase